MKFEDGWIVVPFPSLQSAKVTALQLAIMVSAISSRKPYFRTPEDFNRAIKVPHPARVAEDGKMGRYVEMGKQDIKEHGVTWGQATAAIQTQGNPSILWKPIRIFLMSFPQCKCIYE